MAKRAPPARAKRAAVPVPEEAFRMSGVARLLKIELTSVARERIGGCMRITASHLNRNGRVNGGVLMAFADLMGARGTVANLPPDHVTTTLESKTNFFAAGLGPMLTAESLPLHIGRTTMVWQTTIRNADGRKVAIVTQTQMVMPRPAPAAGTGTDTNGSGKRRTTPARKRAR